MIFRRKVVIRMCFRPCGQEGATKRRVQRETALRVRLAVNIGEGDVRVEYREPCVWNAPWIRGLNTTDLWSPHTQPGTNPQICGVNSINPS